MKESAPGPEGHEIDQKTLAYYRDRADALAESAREERPHDVDMIEDFLGEGARILAVGAGLGRHRGVGPPPYHGER